MHAKKTIGQNIVSLKIIDTPMDIDSSYISRHEKDMAKNKDIYVFIYDSSSNYSFTNVNKYIKIAKTGLNKKAVFGLFANKNGTYGNQGKILAQKEKMIFGKGSVLDDKEVNNYFRQLVDEYFKQNK